MKKTKISLVRSISKKGDKPLGAAKCEALDPYVYDEATARECAAAIRRA